MIVHHMRFSKEVEKVFYDANYFSILRNPVIMFESLFNYMKTVAPQFNKAHTLGKRFIYISKTSRAHLNNSTAPICITDSANGNSKFNRNAIIRVGLNVFNLSANFETGLLVVYHLLLIAYYTTPEPVVLIQYYLDRW